VGKFTARFEEALFGADIGEDMGSLEVPLAPGTQRRYPIAPERRKPSSATQVVAVERRIEQGIEEAEAPETERDPVQT
jgi:hypothetical protein